MFGRLILETYVQDRCRDIRFKDEHLTWFEIKKNDAKRIVKSVDQHIIICHFQKNK